MAQVITREMLSPMAVREAVQGTEGRDGVATVGQTWASFKAAVERGLLVRDDDALASIEYGVRQGGSGRLVRDDAPDGIEIRETD